LADFYVVGRNCRTPFGFGESNHLLVDERKQHLALKNLKSSLLLDRKKRR
jgi:hypothetical protein